MRSSLVSNGNSFLAVSAYARRTLTIVFANRFMYRFQISGSWHSSFWRTSKHWVSWVNTSTTELEKLACSVFFWNWKFPLQKKIIIRFSHENYTFLSQNNQNANGIFGYVNSKKLDINLANSLTHSFISQLHILGFPFIPPPHPPLF